MAIKAVLFDMGNTLVDSRSVSETMTIILRDKGHSINPDDLKKALILGHDKLEYHEQKGEYHNCSAEDFYTMWNHLILTELGIDDPEKLLARHIYNAWFEKLHIFLLPGAEELLRELKRRKIKIGIITNGFRDEVEEVFTGLPIKPDYFDIVVGCNTTGLAKPDPRPFQYALDKLGLLPEETIFVGDSYKKDYLGAKGVGMFPLLYLPDGEPPASDVKYIRALPEILKFL